MKISPARAKQIKDLRGERLKLVADARKILEKAESEKRNMRADEDSTWKDIMSKVDELGERIGKLERDAEADDEDDEEREDDVEEDDEDVEKTPKRKKRDDDGKQDDEEEDEDDERGGGIPRYVVVNGKRYAVKKGVRRSKTPPGGGDSRKRLPGETEHEHRTRQRRSSPEYRQAFWEYMDRGNAALGSRLAQRAIQADSDIVGGYLVAPQEFVGQLIKFVNNIVFIRKLATKYTLKAAQSLGAPSLDTDVSDSDWTSELDTGNEDNSMQFGKRELVPHPLAKRLKVSRRLLRMASVTGGASADNSVASGGAEGLIKDRLGYKFGVTEEEAFLTGNGVNQPLGMFVASSRGISTSRDVLTGSSTGFAVDGLIAAKYNQKVQYWPRLQWIFHRQALQLIRQLKDANGQYLWVPGGLGGETDKMLDIPINMSEYAPNTFTTGQYVGLLGDYSFYWIADSETLEIQRLEELYAAANQVGFIARMELDGMPVLEEAFTRLKTN